jgi:hypothetical protein
MNFCFWPNNPSGVFEYQHMTRNLEKILINDPDFFTCARLLKIDSEYLKINIFNT